MTTVVPQNEAEVYLRTLNRIGSEFIQYTIMSSSITSSGGGRQLLVTVGGLIDGASARRAAFYPPNVDIAVFISVHSLSNFGLDNL